MNAMVVVRPMQWAGLKDVDDVKPMGPDDHECIAELFSVLKKHSKEQRFGLTLLHRHFEMSDDEVLVEHTDVSERSLTLKPAPRLSDNSDERLQTSWMLGEDGQGVVMAKCVVDCVTIGPNHTRNGHRWED